MLKHFQDFICKENLFFKNGKVLAAVSGGIDSVVMLHLLIDCGYKTGIAHCNFGLRGKESDTDEKFVKILSGKYNVPFYSVKFGTSGHAADKGVSVQMAARGLRYEWLEKIRKQKGYSVIAVAHHSDDAIETFFINLVRGTGIAGLSGIKPKTGNIVRPLLFASREDIEDYASKNKLKYREDSSNRTDKYLRNKIRHKLVPLLEEMNPDVKNAVGSVVERLSSIEKIYDGVVGTERKKIVSKHNNYITIDIKRLLELSCPELYLYEFVKQYGFSGDIISKIISSVHSNEGKIFYSPTHRIIKDRQTLLVTELKNDIVPLEYKIVKNTKSLISHINLEFLKKKHDKNFVILKDKNIASLDFEKLKFPLVLRRWKAGDFFYPFGMKGKKKLSDFFTDQKFSILEKENIWLLCSGKDIAWILGQRIDERYCVNEKTKRILTVRLKSIRK